MKAKHDVTRRHVEQQKTTKNRQLLAQKEAYQRAKGQSYEEKVKNLTLPMAIIRTIESVYDMFKLYHELYVVKDGEVPDAQNKIDNYLNDLETLQTGIAAEAVDQLVNLVWK